MSSAPAGQVIATSGLVHDLNQNIVAVALDIELGTADTLFENLTDFIYARRKSSVILEATSGIKRQFWAPPVLITIAIAEALVVSTVKFLGFGLHFDMRKTG